jgi:SIR2-like domain
MRFISEGPDIPDALLASQEKGEAIFICGAGISRTVGLPSFRELVEDIYRELGEDWTAHAAEREVLLDGGRLAGQYDRVLRILERRLAASDLPRNRGMRSRIRSAVRRALTPTESTDLVNHRAVLQLSRDAEGRSRLLTTNFDTLFERAWLDAYDSAPASHAGPAMPAPKVAGFEGILHLHGRLADEHPRLRLSETDLVLTSAEFGDAYLRSGWASRYVYDIARAYTVVLVGYEADDPPMRYLLEVLEADRERYPDLRQVYAFAACGPGDEALQRALWQAKGVEPILYQVNSGSHALLYDTIHEWQRYAEDPTRWRRRRLGDLLCEEPQKLGPKALAECAALLRHGDSSNLLQSLSPEAAWLPVLAENGIFRSGKAIPGMWIATRLNDPEMIANCPALDALDDQSRWLIARGIEEARSTLSEVRRKAWRLILKSRRPKQAGLLEDSWYLSVKTIHAGEIGYDERQLVRRILQPRLKVTDASLWRQAGVIPEGEETLDSLLNIDFQAAEAPGPEEILKNWPQALDAEVALLQVLERALNETLEEASDVGFFRGWDRASDDVPSVAPHAQNAHHSRFYPIARVISGLWDRIAARDSAAAHTLAVPWANSPYLLVRRFYLHSLCNEKATAPREAFAGLVRLDDRVFWLTGAQVEIMRLLTQRWQDFTPDEKELIELRVRRGVPRKLFAADAFEDEDEWTSLWDSDVMKRLTRIASVSGSLSPQSQTLLQEIQARHPKWTPNPGDRDDFKVWHESHSGPRGDPALLANVKESALVAEAFSLQREARFEQGDVWRLVCSSDPERALRALALEADAGRWEPAAWQSVIWTACDKGDRPFQLDLGGHLIAMPDATLIALLPSATAWLQRRRETLATIVPEGAFLWELWDRFAGVSFVSTGDKQRRTSGDLSTRALNEPPGSLTLVLLEALAAERPKRGQRFGLEYSSRLTRAITSPGEPGLLARVLLSRSLAYLDFVDPEWTAVHMLPHFEIDGPDAVALWHARSGDAVGSAALFNRLKPMMFEMLGRETLSDHDAEGLMVQLLNVAIGRRRREADDYQLDPGEVKRALSESSASVRRNAAWQFWRLMGEKDGDPPGRGSRWRSLIGPLFREVWPLDAKFRDEGVSHNLVLMALECEDAFEDAVEAIIDFVVPEQRFQLSHALRLEEHHDHLLHRYPKSFLRLANALIDPVVHPVPSDLSEFLNACVVADASVVHQPAYIRLYGLRRLSLA